MDLTAAPTIEWPAIRRLLVVRLDNLGDVVMTGPALRALKSRAPHLHLTLLASPGGAPAAALLPEVDAVWAHRALWQDLGRLAFDPAREAAFIAELRRRRFDAALILTSFSQSPHPAAIACALAGVPLRIAHARERGPAVNVARPAPPDALHQALRSTRLVASIGAPAPDTRLRLRIPERARIAAQALLRAAGARGEYLVFSPFASCPARTCDPARVARAARRVADAHDLRVVICGAPRERPRAGEVAAILGDRGVDLIGATDLAAFAALIAGARLVITNNSAALHLADALAVPQLVLYAGTDAREPVGPARLAAPPPPPRGRLQPLLPLRLSDRTGLPRRPRGRDRRRRPPPPPRGRRAVVVTDRPLTQEIRMRLMTLNLNAYGERHGPWSERRPAVIAALRDARPDVVALQAVARDPAIDDGLDQAAQLARALPGTHVLSRHAVVHGDGRAEGLAVLSRLPIVDAIVHRLSRREGGEDPSPRILLHATLGAPGGPLHVVCAHVSWVREQAADNVRELLAHLARVDGPILLAGDLNQTPESEALGRLRAAGLVDAWAALRPGDPGDTFYEGGALSRRIDYVLCPAPLAPRLTAAWRVLDGPGAARASDHAGLVVDLDLDLELPRAAATRGA